nr:DNA primase [Chlamydiota bacterium]
MNLLDLAQEISLDPKKSSSTNGGEFKAKCPKCQGGKDRFCIWPNEGKSGRYWCRVCDVKGDGIQFCRDFLGMSFQEACQKLQIHLERYTRPYLSNRPLRRPRYSPKVVSPVSPSWQNAAKNFIHSSHKQLMNEPRIIELLSKRGLSLNTMRQFSLGW